MASLGAGLLVVLGSVLPRWSCSMGLRASVLGVLESLH
jgi:hypothetical protein